MIVGLIVIAAVVVVILTLLGHVPLLYALPAIGIVVAVLLGFAMRRSGPEPPRT